MQTNKQIGRLYSTIAKVVLNLQTLIVLLGLSGFLFSPAVAHAITYPAASWWNGNNCDETYYEAADSGSEQIVLKFTWNGIQVCAYGYNQNSAYSDVTVGVPDSPNTLLEWQCTELVKRFLYLAYGAPVLNNAHGYQVVSRYAEEYPDIFVARDNLSNGDAGKQYWPKAGDVVSYDEGTNGHTSIISQVTITDAGAGDATLTLIEQNAATSGSTSAIMDNWVIQGGVDDPSGSGSDTLTDWLTPKEGWTNNTFSGSVQHILYSVAASSNTNVWTVGYEQPSGSSKKPVTYLNTGSGWTKYSPPMVNSTQNHWLYDVATDGTGDGDAYAVGYYHNHQSLAYRWDGDEWIKKTSHNPASGGNVNDLNGVAIDSGGTAWAVGKYYNGTYHPMLQKYNGTKFDWQIHALATPSGMTSGALQDIAFSSSIDGWAVGNGYVGNPLVATTSGYLIYHFDGTSWTGTLGPISEDAYLQDVVAISSTEAWAVGNDDNGPLVLHYTAANGWVEDTSVPDEVGYPDFNSLQSVSADGGSNVWVVGSGTGGKLFAMHYDGTDWRIANPPYPGGLQAVLNGVAVTSGETWAAGQYTSTPLPLTYQWE